MRNRNRNPAMPTQAWVAWRMKVRNSILQPKSHSSRPRHLYTFQHRAPLIMRVAKRTTDGEMNADLSERFRGAPAFKNTSVPNDDIPTSGPSRVNNDIREYFQLAKKPVNGGAWLDKPEVPSPSEVLREQPAFRNSNEALIEVDESIRPHKIKGAYEDNEDYLRTKYELLREDAVRPLREAIDEIRADPFKDESEYSNQSIGIYDPVYIHSLVFSPRGIATRMAFSLGRVKKHIR
jgi:helicase required for RNAi-mediated heterochromatin assembly 1